MLGKRLLLGLKDHHHHHQQQKAPAPAPIPIAIPIAIPIPEQAQAPEKEKKQKFNINQELSNIKSKVKAQLQNNTPVTFTEDEANIIKENADKIVTTITKELNPIYKKANETFIPIEAYYKLLEQASFKKEMKPLLVDTYIDIETLLEAKQKQIEKIKQAEMMLDLIEFQVEKHNFTRRALEAIKEEAENTTLTKPPTLKRVNSNSSLYPEPPSKRAKVVVEEEEEVAVTVVQKPLTAGGGSIKPKPPAVKPAVTPANAKAAIMGDMLKSPLFLRKQIQHTKT